MRQGCASKLYFFFRGKLSIGYSGFKQATEVFFFLLPHGSERLFKIPLVHFTHTQRHTHTREGSAGLMMNYCAAFNLDC